MKTAFVIQIVVQLGQYRTKSDNTDFLADFDLANIGVLSRFYICINDKIEKLSHCHLMKQN